MPFVPTGRKAKRSGVGPELQSAGAQFVAVDIDQAHVDGNLVTAPAWPAHPQWLAKFLDLLGTKISHE
jgi:protease I